MIEVKNLPFELIEKTNNVHYHTAKVEKRILEGIDEIQCLTVSPWSKIKLHEHKQQWEVWVVFSKRTAYICPRGESHELVNNTEETLSIMAIKGHIRYSYNDLADIFSRWGFSVEHGSFVNS